MDERIIIGIDPNPPDNAAVAVVGFFRGTRPNVMDVSKDVSRSGLALVYRFWTRRFRVGVPIYVAIEKVCAFGFAAAQSVFDTAILAGEIKAVAEQWVKPENVFMLDRRSIKGVLVGMGGCGNDSQVRAGCKKFLGVVNGKGVAGIEKIKGHIWSAVAVSLACNELEFERKNHDQKKSRKKTKA